MQDGQPVPTAKVHFGYTDGIRRPPSAAARRPIRPITNSPANRGSSSCGKTPTNYVVPEPRELGLNGSFAVFKQVETDVVGFEDFLQSNKDRSIPNCWPRRCAGDGATAFLSPCRRIRIARRKASRPNG